MRAYGLIVASPCRFPQKPNMVGRPADAIGGRGAIRYSLGAEMPDFPAQLNIVVQPRASVTAVVGMLGDAIKIRLAAPPVDNAANLELVDFIARTLQVAKREVRITAGLTSKRKTVRIEGVSSATATAALLAAARR